MANEAIPCALTVDQLIDIFNRELIAALCWLAGGNAIDCDKPDGCPFYTVNSPATSGSLDIFDPWMRGMVFPDTTLISGNFTTSASGIYDGNGGSMSFLTLISLPVLDEVNGFVYVAFQETLDSFSAPLLTTVTGNFQVGSNANQRSLDIPLIETVGGDFITSGTLYPSLLVPNLTSVGGDLISIGGLALTDVDISGLTTFVGDFECVNAALTQQAVDDILVQLDSVVVLSGVHNVLLNGGSSATPGAAGITAAANLTGRGVSVNTN